MFNVFIIQTSFVVIHFLSFQMPRRQHQRKNQDISINWFECDGACKQWFSAQAYHFSLDLINVYNANANRANALPVPEPYLPRLFYYCDTCVLEAQKRGVELIGLKPTDTLESLGVNAQGYPLNGQGLIQTLSIPVVVIKAENSNNTLIDVTAAEEENTLSIEDTDDILSVADSEDISSVADIITSEFVYIVGHNCQQCRNNIDPREPKFICKVCHVWRHSRCAGINLQDPCNICSTQIQPTTTTKVLDQSVTIISPSKKRTRMNSDNTLMSVNIIHRNTRSRK